MFDTKISFTKDYRTRHLIPLVDSPKKPLQGPTLRHLCTRPSSNTRRSISSSHKTFSSPSPPDLPYSLLPLSCHSAFPCVSFLIYIHCCLLLFPSHLLSECFFFLLIPPSFLLVLSLSFCILPIYSVMSLSYLLVFFVPSYLLFHSSFPSRSLHILPIFSVVTLSRSLIPFSHVFLSSFVLLP